jgi:hypothetical protein
MRSGRKSVVFLLLLCAFAPGVSAAQPKQGSDTALRATKATSRPSTLLIGPEDGLSVIAAALDSRKRLSANTDCSHLVHDIYERAGFSYAYASSSDLYAGASEFRRVTRPQPGDLVAWPGHVGIVISPAQRSFFSALSSGWGVEAYDSPYWKERGRARFFRYVKSDVTTNRASSSAAPSLTPTAFDPITAGPGPRQNNSAHIEPASASLEEDPATVQVLRVQVIASAKPASEEVSEALLQAFRQTGESLRGQNVFNLPRPLVVAGRLEVQKVKIKGDQGWAEVRITETAALAAGQSNLKKRQEKQRWELRRRDRQSWEVMLPQAALYLSRDGAVEVLAHQHAAMTNATDASSNNVRQKAQLAQLLNALLEAGD